MGKRVTANDLAEELIDVFGVKGTSKYNYERYLEIRNGSIPKTLSRHRVPGTSHERYDPYAVAEWYMQDRIAGGAWISEE
ncbi:MAG: hypothetical protein LBO70_05110 [Clostridiales Family XIII bacterium]|nr:hypothetical protein [Clostridiales Family XIII bacterium]